MTETEQLKQKTRLARTLGLIEGCLYVKEMEDFNKAGLILNLEEVRDILIEVGNENT
jgi:hypothetical protein